MSKTPKLSVAQQKAMDHILAVAKPFTAYAPYYMGRFSTSSARFSVRTAQGHDETLNDLTWSTFEALEKRGLVVKVFEIQADATGRTAGVYVPSTDHFPETAPTMAMALSQKVDAVVRKAVTRSPRWCAMATTLRDEMLAIVGDSDDPRLTSFREVLAHLNESVARLSPKKS